MILYPVKATHLIYSIHPAQTLGIAGPAQSARGVFARQRLVRGDASYFAKVRLMVLHRFSVFMTIFVRGAAWTALLLGCCNSISSQGPATSGSGAPAAGAPVQTSRVPDTACNPAILGSPFIPVDSWVYPAIWRLYALGYIDTVYLGVRPWTRASVAHMLEEAGARLEDADTSKPGAADEAQGIYSALNHEMQQDLEGPCGPHQGSTRIESVYTIARGISGTPLDDSFHLGSTIINDYGRPFAAGFNNYSGVSGYATYGRFAFYVRSEYQGAPSSTGYSPTLAQALSNQDETTYLNPVTGLPFNQVTIPAGALPADNYGRFLEAYLSFQYLNPVISFGKQDEWLGPAQGGSFAYSNNAQNIYALHINRIEPLRVPLLSRLTGPFRYEFLVGALRGHTLMPNPAYPGAGQPNVVNPGDPWVHVEKVSFKPTENVEFGFERTVIWGGEGHSPVTIKNFLRSFFSTYSPTESIKFGPDDPGARFGAIDATYRLPFVRKWLTFFADGEVHDDVSPADAPRRASWRPGLYLSHVPGAPRFDVRFEADMTDPRVSSSAGGKFMYWETIEKQGYTNQGQIFGDWMGREAKGGQAWLTYHLSGNEMIQLGARNQKADKDFITGGTTLNDVSLQVIKRIGKDLEINGNFVVEHWKAPIYLTGPQTVTATTIRITWFPERKVSF